uniref:Serine protease K12H4.7 n=1 Tax=Gongylonema pulchrum TaxID=637853 RepID=A0A183E4X2_9BILA
LAVGLFAVQILEWPEQVAITNSSGHIIFSFYLNLCKDVFGAKFTGQQIYDATKRTNMGRNVLFVNGEVDPWSALSITKTTNRFNVISVSGATATTATSAATTTDVDAAGDECWPVITVKDKLWYYSSYAAPLLLIIGSALTCVFFILLGCVLLQRLASIRYCRQHCHRSPNTVGSWRFPAAVPEKTPIPESAFVPEAIRVTGTTPVHTLEGF